MRIELDRKRYTLRGVAPSKLPPDWRGYCDPPDAPGKSIVYDRTLKDEELLEVLLHEFFHGWFWWLDEEYVTRIAKEGARILWRQMGYRKVD